MRRTKPLKPRFESKFRVTPGCWNWTASVGNSGYGKIKVGEHYASAHRVAHELYVGPVPEGMNVLHRCDNRLCVNPDHLFIGTRVENMADMVAKCRSTQGEKHPRARLTEDQVRQIIFDARSHAEIARCFGVGRTQVSRIKSGQRWGHLFNKNQGK